MAEYKDYIVRYDIQADVSKAAAGLQEIANIAKQFEEPMKTLADAIKQVGLSANQLKQASNITFSPTIDLGPFKRQLESMKVLTRNAAAEMHAAIYGAMSGNSAGTKTIQGSAAKTFGSKSIADLKKDLAAYEKELDKLLGSKKTSKAGGVIRARDGEIAMAQNAGLSKRVAELKDRKRMIDQIIKNTKSEIKKAEEAAAKENKTRSTASTTKRAPSPSSQPSKVTNVTPAVIREWKNAFGDSKLKNLTVNIRGNASGVDGALTVIGKIQERLAALQKQGEFMIRPMLDKAALVAAQTQLRELANLSSAITAPFVAGQKEAAGKKMTLGAPLKKEEQSKLSTARSAIKSWNQKIASTQSRLEANKAIPEQDRTPAQKGQITKDTKAIANYQTAKAEQEQIVKSLQSRAPKAVKSVSKGLAPLTLDIIGNITKTTQSCPIPEIPAIANITKVVNQVKEMASLPVSVKILADQINASIKSLTPPVLDVKVRLLTEGAAQQLQTLAGQTQKPVSQTAKPTVGVGPTTATTSTTKPVTNTKSVDNQATKTGKPGAVVQIGGQVDRMGIVEQIKSIPRQYVTVGIELDTTKALSKLQEFIALVKSQSPQNITLTANGNAAKGNTSASSATSLVPLAAGAATKAAATVSASTKSTRNVVTPKSAAERYQIMKDDAANRAAKNAKSATWNANKLKELGGQQQAWRAQQTAMYEQLWGRLDKRINPTPRRFDEGWYGRSEAQRAAELNAMHSDARAAFAGLTPFEKREQAAQVAADKARKQAEQLNAKRHQQRAEKLRAQAYNSALPFASTKEQANVIANNRRFFRQAITTSGITPTADMTSAQQLQYLNEVSRHMRAAKTAVPWQLQSQINKLQAQEAAAQAPVQSRASTPVLPYRVSGQANKPFFDRARRWAYPLTGQTSFGVRTPMAVDMAKGMGVMFAIGGAMSAIGSSFSQAMEYQNTMRTTQAILQNGTDSYSDESFKGMEGIVRNVGVKTKFSAPEVASASRFLAMAGYDINAINYSIRPIADLALIGDSDLGETADKMTNIMTTFQIAPERMRQAANIMATTATRSNTDLMMLAESAKYGGGVANMYGRNDPNLFADTMALFGVMGNAGVQASSAGTALRMMYQNIFKPNKNQKTVLQMMQSKYGITTRDKDGGYRAMSDILLDMAQRIPENKIPEIVGNLFRITAQPGATATLLAAAGGDANKAQEIGAGIEAMSGKMGSKAGLSSLLSLMLANRESMNGNISGSIAETKQNTITGLWAQVTSTFTEGIVKAFEKKQGGFEGMLKGLRDYLAKPETVQMMQNLIDMIIEIGKTMAWFVGIWADFYNMAPDVIKFWVKAQMAITQFGTLVAPVVALIGVVSRLGAVIASVNAAGAGSALLGVAGGAVGNAGKAGAVGNAVAEGAAMAAGATGASKAAGTLVAGKVAGNAGGKVVGNIVGSAAGAAVINKAIDAVHGNWLEKRVAYNKKGRLISQIRGHERMYLSMYNSAEHNLTANKFARQSLWTPYILPPLGIRPDNTATTNANARFAEVAQRRDRIFGTRARMGRAFMSTFKMGVDATFWASMVQGIKGTFTNLLLGLSKAVGLLVNPVTLAVGGVTALGFAVYKLWKRSKGETDEQIVGRQRDNTAIDHTIGAIKQDTQWYGGVLHESSPAPGHAIGTDEASIAAQHAAQIEERKKKYAYLFEAAKNSSSSKQANDEVAGKWESLIKGDPAIRLALGNRYNDYANGSWKKYNGEYDTPLSGGLPEDNIAIGIMNADNRDKNTKKFIQNRKLQDAFYIEALNDPHTQQWVKELNDLWTKTKDKSQFKSTAQSMINKWMGTFTTSLSTEGMTAERFSQIDNFSLYKPTQDAIRNILTATMNGDAGTWIGRQIAQRQLLTGELVGKTQQYNAAISKVIDDFAVYQKFASADNGVVKELKVRLSMLPNGQIDYSQLINYVKSQCSNLTVSLNSFTDTIAKVYAMMAEAGLVPNDIKSAKDFVASRSKNEKGQYVLQKNDVIKYFNDNIKNNLNSPWIKAGYTAESYWKALKGDRVIDLGTGKITSRKEKGYIVNKIVNSAVKAEMPKTPNIPSKPGAVTSQGNGSTAQNTGSNTPSTSGAGSQNDYASHYSPGAARPTQVNININELAHFDRTSVTSSADEKDLMAAMETRIANAVYQIFAEASNQAHQIMDVT